MSDEKPNIYFNIQIGKLIKEQFLQSKLSIEEFASLIGCNRDNVYDIFQKERINTDHLLIISKVLRYDFFKIYSELVSNELTKGIYVSIAKGNG